MIGRYGACVSVDHANQSAKTIVYEGAGGVRCRVRKPHDAIRPVPLVGFAAKHSRAAIGIISPRVMAFVEV
jgi:hypothetical protein